MNTLLATGAFAALFSALLGGAALLVADRIDRPAMDAGLRVALWRLARLAVIAPFVFALLFTAAPGLMTAFDPARPGEAGRTAEAGLPVYLPALSLTQAQTTGAPDVGPGAVETPVAPTAVEPSAAPSPVSRTLAAIGPAIAGLDWARLLLWGYVLGAAFAVARFALRRLAMAGLIATGEPADEELEALLRKWTLFLGLREGMPKLRVVDNAITPFVTGFKPVVVLPRNIAAADRPSAAEMALVHELVHVRRGDERDRYVGELLTVALWFNPAIKLIESRLAHAREMACDAEVLEAIGGRAQRRAYAGALIEAARAGLAPSPTLSAFGPQNKRNREMRIKAILSHTRRAASPRGLMAAAAGGFALMLAPAFAGQAMATAMLTPEPFAEPLVEESVETGLAKAFTRRAEGETAIRRAVNASPFASLEALESLSALDNIDEDSIIGNPANWMAIGAYASGASATLNLTLEDEHGRPITISVSERDGEHVRLTFTDDEGRENRLVAQDRNGEQFVSLHYDDMETPFFEVRAEGDDADMRFTDEYGPISMQVRDRGDSDDAQITMTDLNTGGSTELVFADTDSGVIYAPADGRISHVGVDEPGQGSVGQYVVIEHEGGWSTIFHTLDAVEVSEGQRVRRGDRIAEGAYARDESDRDHDDDGGDFNININDHINLAIVRTVQVDL